ncbi:hypothetical protein CRYUN_Cryun40dG0079500 [Craigia yunnanensis]
MANLTELILVGCVKCKHLPPLHQLSSLNFLKLFGLKALENVSETEKHKELSSSKSTTIFPSLERLHLEFCPNLKGWWRGDVDEASNAQLPCFPCLSDLTITLCPNLTSMPLFPSLRQLDLTKTSSKPLQQTMKLKMTTSEAPSSSSSSSLFRPFSKLTKITWYPNLTSMPLFPSLRELDLTKTSSKPLQQTMKLKMTTSEAPSSSSSSSLFPPVSKLTKMILDEIEDLDTLPEEFLQNLTSLQSLTIRRCNNLTSMPMGMHCLTSLQKLRISDCPQL